MSAKGSVPPTARSPFRLLGDRVFGPFFLGKLFAATGIWVQNIAGAILVFQLTGSALLVGAISVMQFVPQFVIAPWAGGLSDRVDRRRMLMASRLLAIASSGGLAVWLALVGPEGLPGAWPVLATALLLGISLAVSSPAMQAMVPGLVPNSDLESAIALNSTTNNFARAAGPALGAWIFVAGGPAAAFGLSAAGNLFFVLVLFGVPSQTGTKARDSSVRAGFRYLRETPIMITLLVGVGALGFAVDPVITLTPPIAAVLGQGEVFIGVLASAFGLGAVVAIALQGKIRRTVGLARMGPAGFLVCAVGLGGLAFAYTPAIALVAMAVTGFGFLLGTTSLTSRIHRRVPEELRGRVMALWGIAFLGSRPIAAMINGAITDLASPREAAALAALLSVVAAYYVDRKAPKAEEST